MEDRGGRGDAGDQSDHGLTTRGGGVAHTAGVDLRNVGPVECALPNLGLAALVAVARGWPPEPAYLALVALAAVPFAVQLVRRRFLPVSAYAVPVLAAVTAMAVRAPHADPGPLLLLGLVATVALNHSVQAATVVTGLAIAVVVAADVLSAAADGALLWTVGLGMSLLAGSAIREQDCTLTALERAQEQLAERAAAEERRRVAREVHDVVAHTLAVTMLHLTGARLALADGDTAEAEAGLREAERLGRDSLVGLRHTVGLLTRDEAATAAPAPDLSRLRELVDEYAAGGADVRLTATLPRPVPDDISLATYRIVQESLANAVRHAPGAHVDVVVTDDGRRLAVEVADTGGSRQDEHVSGGGQGLIGMTERAALLGGTCTAGPRDDGAGWRVSAELPLRGCSERAVQPAAEQSA